MSDMRSNFGSKAKDKVTGFGGTIMGQTEYATGCKQVLLSPPVDKDGKLVDSHWFDIDRVELVEAEPVKLRATTDGPDIAAPTK